jgi:hypothetical protein
MRDCLVFHEPFKALCLHGSLCTREQAADVAAWNHSGQSYVDLRSLNLSTEGKVATILTQQVDLKVALAGESQRHAGEADFRLLESCSHCRINLPTEKRYVCRYQGCRRGLP